MRTEADRQFARYQETGDSDALARVFDETAPGLLLLAIHLTKDEVGAEDLVQATFLKVIEHAKSYDPERPFLPWASTILANEVRQQWRQQQRRGRAHGASSPAVEELAGTPSGDPHRVAAEAEGLQTVVRAIDDLEPTYRSAVRLKVVHGMKPGEIARVLELSPEVARTRLSRGLKQLRSRLPEGVAGALAITLGGRGMAQVRATVLDRSRVVHASRAGSQTVFGTGLHGAWPSLLVLMVLTGLASLWWFGDREQEPDVVDQGAAITSEARSSESATESDGLPTSRRLLTRVGDETTPGSFAWSVEGVVSSADNAPLANASVGVSLIRGTELRRLPVVVTDTAGRYEVDLEALRDLGPLSLLDAAVKIDVHAAGHHPRSVVVTDSIPVELQPVWQAREDVVLQEGAVLRARALSPSGRPARGWARARVVSADASIEAPWVETDTRVLGPGESPDPSRLALPVSGPPPFRLEVRAAEGLAVVRFDSWPADGDLGDVRLQTFGEVAGRLVNESGVPVPFHRVRVRSADLTGESGSIHRAESALWRDGPIERVSSRIVRTDVFGVFRAHGMEEGVYVVEMIDGFLGPMGDRLSTGEQMRDVRVSGQVLRIHTLDAAERAIPGTSLLCEWTSDGVRRTDRLNIQDRPGQFDLIIPFGSTWRFRSADPRVDCDPVQHTASPLEPEADLSLLVRSNPSQSRLSLSVHDASGGTIERFVVDPHHLETDALLATVDAQSLPQRGLPAGRYLMHVSSPVGEYDPKSVFLATELEVELREGDETKAIVLVQRGCLVDVELLGGSGPAESELRLERRVDGVWQPAGILVGLDGDGAHRPRLRSSAPLLPGDHVLRVVGSNVASAPSTLSLVAGTVNRMRVSLSPR